MPTPPTFAAGATLTAAQMNTISAHLVKVQTIGTGVSSVTVSNAFSTDYENYLITVNGGVGSTAQSITMQLGASTTTYYSALTYVTYTTGATTNLVVNNGASWYFGESTTNQNHGIATVLSPFLAKYTAYNGAYPGTVCGFTGGYHATATSYTDFKLSVTGTMTGGTIRVYGYRSSLT